MQSCVVPLHCFFWLKKQIFSEEIYRICDDYCKTHEQTILCWWLFLGWLLKRYFLSMKNLALPKWCTNRTCLTPKSLWKDFDSTQENTFALLKQSAWLYNLGQYCRPASVLVFLCINSVSLQKFCVVLFSVEICSQYQKIKNSWPSRSLRCQSRLKIGFILIDLN